MQTTFAADPADLHAYCSKRLKILDHELTLHLARSSSDSDEVSWMMHYLNRFCSGCHY
jgi:hemerythrin-like domain-containing protein